MTPEEGLQELRNLLDQSNDLLRSALSIAQRQGQETNWHAFEWRVRKALHKQAKFMYTGDLPEAAATVTSRTFRLQTVPTTTPLGLIPQLLVNAGYDADLPARMPEDPRRYQMLEELLLS